MVRTARWPAGSGEHAVQLLPLDPILELARLVAGVRPALKHGDNNDLGTDISATAGNAAPRTSPARVHGSGRESCAQQAGFAGQANICGAFPACPRVAVGGAWGVPIIDAHVHLYPPEVNRDPAGWAAAQGELHWAELCTRQRKNGQAVQGFPSVDQLLHDMDAAGMDRAVLLGWYWERPETCAMQNRFYAECIRAHPDRLAAFAAMHPTMGPGAVAWAEDAGFPRAGGTLAALARFQSERAAVSSEHRGGGAPPTGGQPARHGSAVEAVSRPGGDAAGRFCGAGARISRHEFRAGALGRRAPSEEAAALPNVWFDTAASPLL